MRIVPPSGVCTPASTFISVDLPAPFSPTMAWISPGRRSRSTPWSTSTPTKLLRIPSIARRGAAPSDIHPPSGGGRRQHRVGDAGGAQPVGEARQAVGLRARDCGVAVGHEGIKAVEVALGMPDRHDGVAGRARAEVRGVAPQLLGPLAAADPKRLRALLLEAHARALAGDLEVEV